MPVTNPVPSVLKVTLHQPVTLRPSLQSRFFIRYTGTAPTAAQLNTFCGSVGTAWSSNLASLHSLNVSLSLVTAQDLTSASAAQGLASPSIAGSRAGTEAPVQSAVQINFQVARRYRGGKYKIFLNAGVQADQADVGHWTGALSNSMTTGWNNFITAIVAAGWTGAGTLSQVGVSFFTGFTTVTRLPLRARNVNNPRGTPLIDTVTGIVVPTQMGSQRRRRLPS